MSLPASISLLRETGRGKESLMKHSFTSGAHERHLVGVAHQLLAAGRAR